MFDSYEMVAPRLKTFYTIQLPDVDNSVCGWYKGLITYYILVSKYKSYLQNMKATKKKLIDSI